MGSTVHGASGLDEDMQLQQLGSNISLVNHDVFAPCKSLLLTLQSLTTPCIQRKTCSRNALEVSASTYCTRAFMALGVKNRQFYNLARSPQFLSCVPLLTRYAANLRKLFI